jgi:hypothetical protein
VTLAAVGTWLYLRGGGDQWLAVATAPARVAVHATSAKARDADAYFWKTLHEGNYAAIPDVIEAMTDAFVDNPNDPDLARRLAFLHAWRLVERNRLDRIPGNIAEHALLSERYYNESHLLDPSDHRTLGAVAILRMLNGILLHDEKAVREGYHLGLVANRKWPEFNYFTTATALATLPHTDSKFQEAVGWQWKLLDTCGSWQDFEDNLTKEEFAKRYPGSKRVCWDSDIAPHNMEGTLLHMGDMLVKSGDWQAGVDIYQRIKKVRYYDTWPLKEFLAERIENAQSNVEAFRRDYTLELTQRITRPAMLLHTGYYCVSCHQTSGHVPDVANFSAAGSASAVRLP